MKKINKFLVLSFVFILCIGFMESVSYADKYEDRTAYINSARCKIDIDDGELVVNGICSAREGKTIYGEITIQRKGWFSWSDVEKFDFTGYNGELYAEEFVSLSETGKYRAKFTVTCGGETYSVYSNEEKY